MSAVAAHVAGVPVTVADVDRGEALLRDHQPAGALPLAGTSEGRQLRRWLTQLIVTERVVAIEAERLGVDTGKAPALAAILPDGIARHEVGSVTAAALSDPAARALFAHVTRDVTVSAEDIESYHRRNPLRFAVVRAGPDGWDAPRSAPPLSQVHTVVREHLLGAARRHAFRLWLDGRRDELVCLAPGFEHPGDPRQPDNTHRH
ncbi:malonyl CoA-ACP transacylase [Mycobacterium sp. ACS4331]|uniref:DUF7158 domain-containing protein n=1 Tax=Mycobacterium sp. ACS4331 TaxID=1834121 RepID=UPI0007FFE379|nr:malonyl CoA-ACP transacylase [Mycobacterium sp. ACS4331]OBF26856.1 malonyl CoA-ACP transacylase [Mycobacterium sp. ACS4331]